MNRKQIAQRLALAVFYLSQW